MLLSNTKQLLYVALVCFMMSAAKASDLIITGIIDATLVGGIPKAIELYVMNDIPDLSIYGLGSASNGGGSDGQEFTFPADSATAGSYISVSSKSAEFNSYFGYPPTYVTNSQAPQINGDDAMELFKDGAVVDIFGEITWTGFPSQLPWDYHDGWAYRNCGSTPSGSTFQMSEWSFSGRNGIAGCAANAGCSIPFPAMSFNPTCVGIEGTGDPHFRTWKNEHFEFHGQCDIVMTKVQNFANKAMDLEIHLRTKMVRYWSFIKTASIRIGNDILEIEGSAAKENGADKRHYHINFEHLGPLTQVGGYPVTISPRNNKYTIDLDKDFPGQKIEIKTFKEFVSVKIIGATEESFGNSVGITGDFKNGKTLARDGVTVLDDFNELGLEWQVLPSDGKLFHEMSSAPQFPELCYLPEDPRGDRARRLAESDITEEAAEAACASLKDDFDRKGCVYDILATQDMDMVGAY